MDDTDKKRKRQDEEPVDSTKKEESGEQNENETSSPPSVLYSSLQRPNGQGMKPKSILMGIYGPRGEKIRHVVHEGALALPESAIRLLQDSQTTCGESGATLQDSFQLPAIDGVVRPCLDSKHAKSIVITELTSEERPPPPPPQPVVTMVMNQYTGQLTPSLQQPPPPTQPVPQEKWQTSARNWKLNLLPSIENNVEEERIRGGGGEKDGQDDDVEMVDAPSNDDEAAETGATTAATGNATEATTNQASTTSTPSIGAGQAAAAAAAEASATNEASATTTSAAATATTAPTTTAPTTVASNTPSIVSSTVSQTPNVPAVIPLPKKPDEQWQQHIPPPNDEMHAEVKTPHPSWYNADSVSDLEQTMLPEWFDGSATHRTADTYLQARRKMIDISNQLKHRNLTATNARRTIAGDAGSLLRLHKFLVTWGFINEDAINDSAPTAPGMREQPHVPSAASSNQNKSGIVWDDSSREELMDAVVDAASTKKRKTSDDIPIDWQVVSNRVGNGATATECEKVFLALPLEAAAERLKERSITPDMTSSEPNQNVVMGQELFKSIVENARPEVVQAATDAALAATDNVSEAQKAGLLALVASEAAGRAKKEEETVSRLLAELQEQRLQKLENRMALLDDVEGILEAERVALELERRDLYTARCRHWFGGAS